MTVRIYSVCLAFICCSYINAASAMIVTVQDTIFFCDGVQIGDSCALTTDFALVYPNIAATGDGTAVLEIFGDFDAENETATVGGAPLLDNNPDNDAFANDAFGDVGNEYVGPILIPLGFPVPQSGINNVLGTTSPLTFVISSAVQNLDLGRAYATFTVKYPSAAVPIPATLTLVGLGLAGIGWRAKRRNQR